jgi:sulfite reductase (NADPH) hemoprotein beta-component
MYRYDPIDQRIVNERVAQFRDQTQRFLAGTLSEEAFRPLRLQNGLYIQRHAPMLRVAIPYGHLSSRQLRKLAQVADRYDRGYGHFTTRQNIQFNWPALESVPDILAELAEVEMHAIQTSGNCIRNTTSDPFAGVAADEIIDPRPWGEIIRQWSTLHPEFAYLPRKFKIAISGSQEDRAGTLFHDIGVQVVAPSPGLVGFRVLVGGGLGRTPILGHVIREFLPWEELLNYLDAILRVYNRFGRRDNKYKARIKILVKEQGVTAFTAAVEAEWQQLAGGPATLTEAEVGRISAHFVDPPYLPLARDSVNLAIARRENRAFDRWVQRSAMAHKRPGYVAITLSLKPTGVAPGDIDSVQMRAVADLADRYSFGEVRVAHEQNLILADVPQDQLFDLYGELKPLGLATPNIGLLTDIIACPGGDFCSLANAVSIPVAQAIQERFDDLDFLHDIGDIELNISGCMNACGHHHVGHIGILGVDKHGEEFYQVSIGGSQGLAASLGKVIGPAFARADMPDVVDRLITTYVRERRADERFIDTVRRTGIEPFKAHVYAEPAHA